MISAGVFYFTNLHKQFAGTHFFCIAGSRRFFAVLSKSNKTDCRRIIAWYSSNPGMGTLSAVFEPAREFS